MPLLLELRLEFMEVLRRIPVLPQPTVKKKSRLSYSITFKLAAVRHAEAHGNRATARYLGINEKQIRDWRSKKLSLMNTNANAKRLKGAGRQITDPKRERDLKAWIEREQKSGKAITHSEVQEKAKLLSSDHQFKASSGWLRRWKIRHSLSLSKSMIGLNNNNNNNNNYTSATHFGALFSSDKYNYMYAAFQQYKNDFEKDKEFKDKINCALTLLELQNATIFQKYKSVC